MHNPLAIKNGRVIDPSQSVDRVTDLLIIDGKIAQMGHLDQLPDNTKEFDASNLIVSPGFVDIHTHLREPGEEHKETIATGTAAAAKGGFTTVCAMPNTDPPLDTRSAIEFVKNKATQEGTIRVLTIGCVTKGRAGIELSDMADLASAGVIGFSDDGSPVVDPNLMRQALSYSKGLGLPIINHCEVLELTNRGSMNEGWISTRLGLQGIPNSSETVMVSRDIELAETTGGHVHIAHVSTAGSLELIRRAKQNGIHVTCEVTPHHLTLTDDIIMSTKAGQDIYAPLTAYAYDTSAKVSPPLRLDSDVQAMVAGIEDNTIDCIATDHAPHSTIDKNCTFQEAAFGISVLETALGSTMSLFHDHGIPIPVLIEKLTAGPTTLIGSNLGTLKERHQADITIFDPYASWVVDPSTFVSGGKNTPLSGKTLRGKVVATFLSGTKIYCDPETFHNDSQRTIGAT